MAGNINARPALGQTERTATKKPLATQNPIKILFVDDNASFLEITERYFEKSPHNFSIETCQEPEEALGKIEEKAIDCIISDYQMPQMDGLELLEKIRQEYPGLPFLLITSKGSEDVASEAISKGVTDYIQKGGMEKYELVAKRVKNAVARSQQDEELNKRLKQQKVTAELGQKALGGISLDDLMHEAAEKVAECLDNDYCKVLDLQGDELLLRQGVGWKEGIVGNATVKAAEEENSQASYTLSSEEPVIVTDMENEDRFEGPELLTSHNVKSGISTIIGHPDDPWGILGTHDTEKKNFDWHDVEFVQNIANILANAIERKGRQDK